MIEFLITSLAVWRLSSLLAREDGPFLVFAKFRNLVGVRYDRHNETYGNNEFATGLLCVWCNSLWISAFASLLLAASFSEWIVYSLALSTVTIIVDRIAI